MEFPNLEMSLDPDTREVKIRDESIALARREFDVLYCLGRHTPVGLTMPLLRKRSGDKMIPRQ
jgi:DNA-binding response OmpR family regulator